MSWGTVQSSIGACAVLVVVLLVRAVLAADGAH